MKGVAVFIVALMVFLESAHTSIKAILFDCDGTLIDNSDGYFLDWEHALKCQGYDLTTDAFWHFMDQHGLVGFSGADEIIVKFYCELLGRDCGEQLLKDKRTFSAQLHANYPFPAIEPTVLFLHQLGKLKHQLGLKLGIASGADREHILRVLKRLNVDSYFDVIVSGSEDLSDYYDTEGTNKPKPYVYLHAAKMLGLCPEQCVAIEDSKVGVSAAVSAGCITIAVPNRSTRAYDLSHAHLKLDSFSEMHPRDFLLAISHLTFIDE